MLDTVFLYRKINLEKCRVTNEVFIYFIMRFLQTPKNNHNYTAKLSWYYSQITTMFPACTKGNNKQKLAGATLDCVQSPKMR